MILSIYTDGAILNDFIFQCSLASHQDWFMTPQSERNPLLRPAMFSCESMLNNGCQAWEETQHTQ